MRLRPFFSYYGAKWRAAVDYPPPSYSKVIEPFAGSACYSLLHYTKDILLVDYDPTIARLWKWLIQATPKDINALPDTNEGMMDGPEKDLIGFWYVKGAVKPAPRPYGWAKSGRWDNQYWSDRTRARIATQVEYIKHWKVVEDCYTSILNTEATWFVDPPYVNAGKHYVHSDIDYDGLAEWCRDRLGQTIVCEQEGATWLPFEPFKKIKSLRTGKSAEVFWCNEPVGLFSFCS
jgi:hypothetical protein